MSNILWIIILSTTKITTPLQLLYLSIYFAKNANTNAAIDQGVAGQEYQENGCPSREKKEKKKKAGLP